MAASLGEGRGMTDEPVDYNEYKRRRREDRKAEVEPDPRTPEFSDEALALRFAEIHADNLRYVSAWSKWFAWTGNKWAEDVTLHAFDSARAVCRDAAGRCEAEKIAAAVASAKTVAAVERLAKADRRLAATVEQWDADPMLLNTPAGVVDLRTGATRPHRVTDYMTKSTAAGPGGEWETWHRFLERITDDDEELQKFLQRVAGYALTGNTSAHALFFGFGTGSNGKSVMLDTLSGIMGDYARTAPIETFCATNGDRHPTELAGLRGARLVTAIETEEGWRWAESKIKTLTGGDRIAARFMRGDFFEYTPQFKLIIAGNHKPGLRSVDEAILRRFHLIPFTVTIPAEERDPHLKEKLRLEWPGILGWAIRGCLDWQRIGLSPPKAVTAATAAYLEAEDALAAWLDDCCDLDPKSWENSTALFSSWKIWADNAGEFAGTTRRFSQALENRGFQSFRKMTGRGFEGLRIRPGSSWRDTP
jgi:putative DNA primase/helicase